MNDRETATSAVPAVFESDVAWDVVGKISRETLLTELRTICSFNPGELLEVGVCRSQFRERGFFDGDVPRWVTLDIEPRTGPDVVGSVYALPFPAGSFDTILCTQVLEHLAMPVSALVEMHRVLRAGGRIVVSAPQSWALHLEPDDYFRYTRHGLEALLVRTGFSVEEIRSWTPPRLDWHAA
jgi:SAM-dependent methyltransferase